MVSCSESGIGQVGHEARMNRSKKTFEVTNMHAAVS